MKILVAGDSFVSTADFSAEHCVFCWFSVQFRVMKANTLLIGATFGVGLLLPVVMGTLEVGDDYLQYRKRTYRLLPFVYEHQSLNVKRHRSQR
jgi:hypothetical protein